MRVVCTAGHVDHGKSSLVRALTGMEPDRFEEEQRRGLTIDLGFAWTDVGPHTIAFVDLPGHERFIANMLAGAGPVETALLVVAADEGWKPQSQEHLDVLSLLAVPHGLVALTKIDAVDDEHATRTEADVREHLAGSALAQAEIIRCSAVTGAGLDQLRERLAAMLDAAPAPVDLQRPRLWVDRTFSVRGAGTVVTGTLTGGSLDDGDELVVLPSGQRARVRGLQRLNQPTPTAEPGSRVAVNLSGVERHEIQRGDALAHADQWLTGSVVEAWVQVIAGQELTRTGAWHLHVGSARRSAKIIPVMGKPLQGNGFVRIELDQPLALAAGDRFVLREAGRWITVAGGVVLDAAPGLAARSGTRDARADALHAQHEALAHFTVEGDASELVRVHVRQRGWADLGSAAALLGLTLQTAQQAAQRAQLLPLGPAVVHPAAGAQWSHAVMEALRSYHQDHPLERAAPKDIANRAAQSAGCPRHLVSPFLDALAGLGRVVVEGPGLRDVAHAVALDPAQAAAREALLAELSAQPFAPPRVSEVIQSSGIAEPVLKDLERTGALVRLGPDLVVPAETIAAAVARLREVHADEAFTAAQAKQAWGTSRKYAVPLLEELDRRRLTLRSGDLRTLNEAAARP